MPELTPDDVQAVRDKVDVIVEAERTGAPVVLPGPGDVLGDLVAALDTIDALRQLLDDANIVLCDRLRTAEAPQPRVLWRGETWRLHGMHAARSFDKDGNELRSYIHTEALDVPPGTRVVIIEGTEEPE